MLLAEGIVFADVLRVLGEQLPLILDRGLAPFRKGWGGQQETRGWTGAILGLRLLVAFAVD